MLKIIFSIGIILIVLTACGAQPGTETGLPITDVPAAESTATATPIPVPMAVLVNGEGITVELFESELARFLKVSTDSLPLEEANTQVLNYLIDELLLAQAAQRAGFEVTEPMLQERIDALTTQLGSQQALQDWQTAHGYTPEIFRISLERGVAAAWQRDEIIAGVPRTAEQVHVQQILLYNEETAQRILTRLQNGESFETLAAEIDPVTRGVLGWFPRGYLLETSIEEIAFAMQPGQTSQIITTQVGFHLIKVQERNPAHTLSPDALLTLQERALLVWLETQRAQSTIVLTP